MEESGTGVPPVIINQDHAQDERATLKKRRGAYLPHWTLTTPGTPLLFDFGIHFLNTSSKPGCLSAKTSSRLLNK